jgi:Tol biopolymer transport system component
MKDFDVSADGKLVAYAVRDRNQGSHLWLASLERRFPPRQLSPPDSNEIRPIFGPAGEIFSMEYASNSTWPIHMIRPDGKGREQIRPDAEGLLQSASPDGEWITLRTSVPSSESGGKLPIDAYPIHGGAPVRVCQSCTVVRWAADGRFIYLAFTGMGTQIAVGKTVALPVPPGKHLPDLPVSGVKTVEEAAALPGATVIEQGNISPGKDPSTYAFTKVTAQRNLYRVPIDE